MSRGLVSSVITVADPGSSQRRERNRQLPAKVSAVRDKGKPYLR